VLLRCDRTYRVCDSDSTASVTDKDHSSPLLLLKKGKVLATNAIPELVST